MNKRILILVLLLLSISINSFGGIDFDNADDFVGSISGSGTAVVPTLCAWIYPEGFAAGSDPDWGDVIAGKLDSGIGSYLFYVNGGGSNVVVLKYKNSTSTYWGVGTTSLSVNTWYYVCAVCDSSANKLYVYVNGVQEGNDSPTAWPTNTATFEIGRQNGGSYSYYFNGKIANVALWNTALSTAQINQIYLSKIRGIELQIAPSNLVGYWPLDDQPDGTSFDADTAYDYGPNRYNGTGNDGANNTGLTAKAEEVLSYPPNN